ncbi:MAG: hypothetical protein ACP5I1_10075 [Candidatus Hinthialibacter sp.]
MRQIFIFIMVFAFSWTSRAAEPPALKKIDQNGIIIEYLPKIEPLAQKVHEWLSGYLKQHSFDLNRDFFKLKENQSAIIQYISKQLAMEESSQDMIQSMTEFFLKFQNAGSAIPNIRHIQLWLKKDLKHYLDNGGNIPGYKYTPGPDGENQLSMEQDIHQSGSKPDEPIPIQPYLFPLILKSENSDEYFTEAQENLAEMHQQFQQMSSSMAGLIMMLSIQLIIQDEMRPPMRFFNWFTRGAAGYMTAQILNDHVSVDSAKYFLESYSIEPYLKIAPRIHLVKWIGGEKNKQSRESKEEIVKENARCAFSIYEIMGLVQRHGQDCLPKIFADLRKKAPVKKTDDSKKPEEFSGQDLVEDLDLLLNAIQSATGEDFRRRLLQYSQIEDPTRKKDA